MISIVFVNIEAKWLMIYFLYMNIKVEWLLFRKSFKLL